jgi:hypothetical protein
MPGYHFKLNLIGFPIQPKRQDVPDFMAAHPAVFI